MKVAIIGGGPAGMTAAYVLTKGGAEVEVFESGVTPGGMARTIRLWNQSVDLGPHRFFSKNRRVNELWLELVGNDYRIVERKTRILYNGKLYSYPLNIFNTLTNLGIGQAVLCLLYYLKEFVFPTKQDGSIESWITRHFGKHLFAIFFKSYNEKLWGLPCSQIDSDFASQRIRKITLMEVLKKFILNNKNEHRTLVEQFAYPIHGTGSVYQKMAASVEHLGAKIHFQTPVEKIRVSGRKADSILLADGRVMGGYDHVISTMPLSLMVSRLDGVPGQVKEAIEALTFRNTIIVYLNVDTADLFPDQWIYVQSAKFKTGRITNFRNWVPELYGEEKSSVLALEYWCSPHDTLWKDGDDRLIALASNELSQMRFKHFRILNGHVERIPRCYPVYIKGYKDKIKLIQEFLKNIQGLSVIGRYGAFKYNNQDHSVLMGIMAAENLLRGQQNDLWAVNTDYEDYQESFIITETGLVKQ